jgi:hypothetical protein
MGQKLQVTDRPAVLHGQPSTAIRILLFLYLRQHAPSGTASAEAKDRKTGTPCRFECGFTEMFNII